MSRHQEDPKPYKPYITLEKFVRKPCVPTLKRLSAFWRDHAFPYMEGSCLHAEAMLNLLVRLWQDFSRQEQEEIAFAIQEAIAVIKTIFELGMERALSGMRVTA